MKKERNFYYFLVMISYIIAYTIALILACRKVEIAGLVINGSIIIYPLTYFLAILFAERYGEKEAKNLIILSIFAIIIASVFITVTSFLPVATGIDGLEPIFNLDFRIVFASIIGFLVSQCVCLKIYYYLSGIRGFKFVIASVIAITIDSLIFIPLAYLGTASISYIFEMFVSQYICNIIMVIAYSLCFIYIVDAVVEKPKNSSNPKIEIKPTLKEEIVIENKTEVLETKPKKKRKRKNKKTSQN